MHCSFSYKIYYVCFESVMYFCLQRMFLRGLLNRAADFNTSNVNVAIALLLKTTITSELSEAPTGMQLLFSYFNVFPTEMRNFVASQVDAVEVRAIVSENILNVLNWMYNSGL